TPVDPATTSTETWGDWTTSTPVDPATTSTETWGDWSTDPAAVTTSTETWADWTSSTAVATATTGGWSAPSSGSHPNGHGGAPGITSNGDSWGMTYSPYTAQGGCKDAGTVAADLAIIAQKGFTSVRVYSTDCNTLENIGGAARNNGLK